MYAVLFPEETAAAFSNHRFWRCVGVAAAYGYSFHLCSYSKLYILMVALFLGMTGYFTVEYIQYKHNQMSSNLFRIQSKDNQTIQ